MSGCRCFSGWLLVLAVCTAGGCGPARPQFTLRAETAGLMEPAQAYLHDLLAENFGTPTEPVAWERFPVRYHAASAIVGEDSTDASIVLAEVDEALPIEPEMAILFASGALVAANEAGVVAKDAPAVVQSYDRDTKTLALRGAPGAAPAAGDRVIIGPGVNFQHGRMLYAEHCQHCHGVGGDGAGPTAEYLSPPPRDYRRGIFKFTSTQSPLRAHRDDLARIIENGIPGTYMPSFKLLTPAESSALVEYVMWLACRGETELRRVQTLAAEYSQKQADENSEATLKAFEAAASQFATDFNDETTIIGENWVAAQAEESIVVPQGPRVPADAASIARGREIFRSATAKCAQCHGEAGRGDGSQTLQVQKDAGGNERDKPGLYDDWNHEITPRDLTAGIYRGGRRPIDVYRRVYAGIKGTPMPASGTSLSNEQIWDVVNYVLHIPFEKRAPGTGPFVPSAGSPGQVATSKTEDSGVRIQGSGSGS